MTRLRALAPDAAFFLCLMAVCMAALYGLVLASQGAF